MKFLKLKIPPPIIFLIAATSMWGITLIAPNATFSFPYNMTFTIIFLIIGGLFAVASILTFIVKRTTIDSIHVEKTSSLVTTGIYAITRNPMYLSLLCILLAWAGNLSNIFAFFVIPLFVLYINYFQIIPEEIALESKYGDEFIRYKRKVRRWLW